jgi:putative membrane protein
MPSETMVRDQLALDRTLLANERTLLAYVRTALALVGAGAGGALVFETSTAWVLGGILMVLGPVTATLGMFRFRAVRSKLLRVQAELLLSGSTPEGQREPGRTAHG